MDPVPRIQGFMSNLPNTIADIISKQTAVVSNFKIYSVYFSLNLVMFI